MNKAAINHEIITRAVKQGTSSQHRIDVLEEAKNPENLAKFRKQYQEYRDRCARNIEILSNRDSVEHGEGPTR